MLRIKREFDMPRKTRIALDAMGGDFGPSVTIAGAEISLDACSHAHFLLIGDESAIRRELERHPRLARCSEVRHSAVSVTMDAKPSQALRYGRCVSSMWMAIDAVKKHEADVAVSAGNTGALMAMAKVCLRTMAGVDRPALACLWPTLRGQSVVLDVGASMGANARHLVDLAIMGSAMARIIRGLKRPTVGILNIGNEEIKGVEEVRSASSILRQGDFPELDYKGFLEADAIGDGAVDVVVTEGFTGNIALKTAEGTARQVATYARGAMNGSLMARLGYLLARRAFDEVRMKMDANSNNGAVFLGLEGIVVKSHGAADAIGFAHALEVGYEMANSGFLKCMRETLAVAHKSDDEIIESSIP